MARILVGVYMVRYPLGGMLSMYLQLVVGLHRLGHDVVVVERSGWPESCFDPARGVMTDDCATGVAAVHDLLSRHGLGDRWCFVDQAGRVHGMTERGLRMALDECEVFLDAGTHGLWLDRLPGQARTVLLDGEPGWTQMRWALRQRAGYTVPRYDVHLTVGLNVGADGNRIPTAGVHWRGTRYPVLLDEFPPVPPDAAAPYTTVMNWQAHDILHFEGTVYGQKDMEFARFMDLPVRVAPVRMEVAVAGRGVPRDRLRQSGWGVRDAHGVTATYDAYRSFVRGSRGEFGVAKNVFVATSGGWFGDRSAAYLAAGRPIVLQDTGASAHLPSGEGFFAVTDVDEAAAAVLAIESDYARHSRAARELAREYLAADRVLPAMLAEVGV